MLNISKMLNRFVRNKSEGGMASILTVMVLMTILSLISLGFSTLMNREERQALDRQLSTAAYYAAESGVNDARDYLNDATKATHDSNGCAIPTNDNGNNFLNNGDISGDNLIKYSCVVVNPNPKILTLNIPAGQSKVINIASTQGQDLSSLSRLYFSWENTDARTVPDPPAPLGAYGVMPQQSATAGSSTGLLRVGVYPMTSGGCTDSSTYSRYISALGGNTADASIECASRNYFMYPSAAGGGTPNCAYSSLRLSNGCVRYDRVGDNGGIVPGNCTNPAQKADTDYASQATETYCNTLISNLLPVKNNSSPTQVKSYYLRLTAVYKSLTVYIQATDDGSSSAKPQALAIGNAQAVIDVTGQGNDITRRIRVQAPLQDEVPQLNFGLQSMESICKLFRNNVVNAGEYDSARFDSNVASYNSDNMCDKPTGNNIISTGGLPGAHNYPPPTVNLTVSPNNTDQNISRMYTLNWSTTDADDCQPAGGPWSGNISGVNSFIVGPLTLNSTTTFTISCTGPGGIKTDNATVTVNPPPPPPPNIWYWGFNGGNSWSYGVDNANYCEIHLSGGGVQPISIGGPQPFPATAGGGGESGQLWCWDSGVGPAVSGWAGP